MTEVKKRKSQKEKPITKGKESDDGTKEPTSKRKLQSAVVRIKDSQSKGKMRHVMTACKILLAVLLIPPFLNYAALQRESSVLKPEGEFYDIGWGQKLFFSCKGKGAPTVLNNSRYGNVRKPLYWNKLSRRTVIRALDTRLAETIKVCVYDRAGLGFSERPFRNSSTSEGSDNPSNLRNKWTPFTAERMVEDLHQLLTVSSDQPKPFILVGAELGALVAQFYTLLYEEDISGLILINPLTNELFSQDDGIWVQNWFGHLIPSYQTVQLGAAIGVTRFAIMLGLLQHPMYMSNAVSEETISRQKYLMCQPRHLSSMVDEHFFINETFLQLGYARRLRQVPERIPVTFITGNYYDEQMPGPLNKAWAKSEQALMTKRFPHSQHIVVNGGDRHMLYQNPEAIIEPVRKAVRQWRNKHGKTRDT